MGTSGPRPRWTDAGSIASSTRAPVTWPSPGRTAERLGLSASTLTYDTPVVTANGKTRAARVQLDYVAVAGAKVEQVPALVIADGLSSSLLGMSYLGRLSRFEATPTSLVLRP